MRFQCLILALLLSVARLDAQVYAVGIGPNRGPLTVLRVDEHSWLVGFFGLVQFRARTGERAPWVRQTTIHLGSSHFTSRLPAAATASLFGASLLLLMAVISTIGRPRHRHDNAT